MGAAKELNPMTADKEVTKRTRMKKLDFFIDESPRHSPYRSGKQYFIDGILVSRQEFVNRREKECSHRYGESGYDRCIDCRMQLEKRVARGEHHV
jgi:hypothetical protein